MSLARYQTTPPAALGSFRPMRISYSNAAMSVVSGSAARSGGRTLELLHHIIEGRRCAGRRAIEPIDRLLDAHEAFPRGLTPRFLMRMQVPQGSKEHVRRRSDRKRRVPERRASE